MRFYEPSSGHITLDGIEFKNMSKDYVRSQIGQAEPAYIDIGLHLLHCKISLVFCQPLIAIPLLRTCDRYVSQEPVLFAGTIAQNIGKGIEPNRGSACNAKTTMDQVIEAAKLANADRFIDSLFSGYDTEVVPEGLNLSGGKK